MEEKITQVKQLLNVLAHRSDVFKCTLVVDQADGTALELTGESSPDANSGADFQQKLQRLAQQYLTSLQYQLTQLLSEPAVAAHFHDLIKEAQ
jgi:hypothetical protein